METNIGIRIDERRFKPDIDLLDRYLAYSAKLLRLALLRIAGYGFLLKEVFFASGADHLSPGLRNTRWYLIGGIVSLGFSAGCALQHRIFATGAVACILSNLRCRVLGKQPRADKEANEMRFNLKWSARLLQLSAIFLGLGAAAVAFTFAKVLWP